MFLLTEAIGEPVRYCHFMLLLGVHAYNLSIGKAEEGWEFEASLVSNTETRPPRPPQKKQTITIASM